LDRGQLFLADLRRESCEEIEIAALGIEAAHYERSVQVQPDQVVSLLTNETQAKLVERLSDFGEDTQGFGKRLWESRVVRGRHRQRSYEELEGPPVAAFWPETLLSVTGQEAARVSHLSRNDRRGRRCAVRIPAPSG
jgi:hypothetical protein